MTEAREWQAACDCGWKGAWYADSDIPVEEARLHTSLAHRVPPITFFERTAREGVTTG